MSGSLFSAGTCTRWTTNRVLKRYRILRFSLRTSLFAWSHQCRSLKRFASNVDRLFAGTIRDRKSEIRCADKSRRQKAGEQRVSNQMQVLTSTWSTVEKSNPCARESDLAGEA